VKESITLPAVDRIYTITEGKGITGVLCGSKPCPDVAAPVPALANAAAR